MASLDGRANDPMAVNLGDKYHKTLDKIWNRLPNFVGSFIATVAVFILGATIRGEWLLVLVHFIKYLRYDDPSNSTEEPPLDFSQLSLENYHLKDLQYFFIAAMSVGYGMYLGIGGFLHWYYYVRQRHLAREWKCQPDKWLSPELERHEIMLGSFSLFLGNTLSAALACYVYNGGPSEVYYGFGELGWVWFVLQFPAIFIYQDYLTYWTHRFYHFPFFYKNFHKLHHKYKQPTAFSVTAIHPVEFLHMQIMLLAPMFLVPIHWFPFVVVLLYTYYHGIIDHSGVNFKAQWWQPWQPDCIFHDNHHQYFHVNFAFNIEIWDKIHGTYRQKDKIYHEDTYYGKGKTVQEATSEEIRDDIHERESENPLAYKSNTMEFEVTEEMKKKVI